METKHLPSKFMLCVELEPVGAAVFSLDLQFCTVFVFSDCVTLPSRNH